LVVVVAAPAAESAHDLHASTVPIAQPPADHDGSRVVVPFVETRWGRSCPGRPARCTASPIDARAIHRYMARSDQIRRALTSINALPPMPEVLARIWQMVDNPRTDANQLAEVVSDDPGLSAELLKLVNSSYFGLGRRVASVKESITLVGFEAVKNLSITIVVRNGLLPRHRAPDKFDRVDFWKHCVGTGIATEILSHTLHISTPEIAFAAGLLHDAGVMVIDLIDPASLAQLVELIDQGTPIAAADEQVLGCSHGEVGRWLAEQWHFPESLVEPIANHHDPLGAKGEHQRLACLVYLADMLMSPPGRAYYGADPPGKDDPILARLGMDVPGLLAIREIALLRLGHANEMLQIGEPPGQADTQRAA
jgi:HD-like signal output (HDOD) protein